MENSGLTLSSREELLQEMLEGMTNKNIAISAEQLEQLLENEQQGWFSIVEWSEDWRRLRNIRYRFIHSGNLLDVLSLFNSDSENPYIKVERIQRGTKTINTTSIPTRVTDPDILSGNKNNYFNELSLNHIWNSVTQMFSSEQNASIALSATGTIPGMAVNRLPSSLIRLRKFSIMGKASNMVWYRCGATLTGKVALWFLYHQSKKWFSFWEEGAYPDYEQNPDMKWIYDEEEPKRMQQHILNRYGLDLSKA